MNNKGFAITGIIYGLMLLFILVLTSFLSILIGRNKRIDALIESTYDSIEYPTFYIEENDGVFKYKKDGETNFTEYVAPEGRTDIFITSEKGKYVFNSCVKYFPENVMFITDKLKYGENLNNVLFYYKSEDGTSYNNVENFEIVCEK